MRWNLRRFRPVLKIHGRAKRRCRLRIESLEPRAVPAVSGLVFKDSDGDGVRDTGDTGIAAVTVELFQGDTRVDSATTGTDGAYTFATVNASTDYQVRINTTQAALNGLTLVTADIGSDDAVDSDASLTGTDAAVDFTTDGANSDVAFDAGFAAAAAGPTGSISGQVFLDFDNSGAVNGPDAGIAGVTVTLSGGDLTTPLTTQTDASGNFSFTGLAAGTYTLTETQPTTPATQEGTITAGTGGGTAGTDTIDGITIGDGEAATGNLFAEVPLLSTGGTVFEDTNGNGQLDSGESGIAGVTITLTGTSVVDGAITPLTTTTDSQGVYAFTGLTPGTYTITETQPTGVTDGAEQNGTPAAATVSDNTFTGIDLTSTAAASSGFNFGETAAAGGAGSIAGIVFVDANGDGTQQTGEAGIAELTIHLTGTDDQSQAVDRTTTTDSTGAFSFTGLAAGTYTLAETQPTSNPDGTDTAGTAGGTASTNDTFSGITLTDGQTATGYLFGEGAATTPPPTSSAPDLTITQSLSSNLALPGTTITITYTVHNRGTSAVTGVSAEPDLGGLTFVSASSSDYDADTGIWTVGDLAAGASASLRVTVRVPALGSFQASVQATIGASPSLAAPVSTGTATSTVSGATPLYWFLSSGWTSLRGLVGGGVGTQSTAHTPPPTSSGPATPTLALSAASDTGTPGDNSTDLATVTLTGTTTAGANVTLVQTGATATADSAGAYSFAGVPLTVGANSFTVNATNSGGTSTGTATITRVDSTSQAPATPTLALDSASDTGTVGDGSTDLATVTLVGTTTAGASLTLVETGATATADTSGAFSFASVPLVVGANTFTVNATNSGGTSTGTATITRIAATNSAPTVATTLSPVSLSAGNSTTLDLTGTFDDADIANSTIRFDTSAGAVNVELFDRQAPKTVANFLNYVTDGDYTDAIFHRSAKLAGGVPFVLQGGGFAFETSPAPSLAAIPTDPAVQNEPDAVNRSNVRGTLAMAKLGGQPNSATDQFFFNLGDNSALDTNNGGFTVFGRVVGAADQTVVDQLAAIPTQDQSAATALPPSQQGVFGEIPLTGYTGTNFPSDTARSNYAIVNGVSIVSQPEALTYTVVGNTNPTVAAATIDHNRITFQASQAGTTTVTIRATDKAGASVETTVTVTVGA